MRRKELGDDPVRITVRLPADLYAAVLPTRRRRFRWEGDISAVVRHALEHMLECPEHDALEHAKMAMDEARRLQALQDRGGRRQ